VRCRFNVTRASLAEVRADLVAYFHSGFFMSITFSPATVTLRIASRYAKFRRSGSAWSAALFAGHAFRLYSPNNPGSRRFEETAYSTAPGARREEQFTPRWKALVGGISTSPQG
jgi:hypothetical protein